MISEKSFLWRHHFRTLLAPHWRKLKTDFSVVYIISSTNITATSSAETIPCCQSQLSDIFLLISVTGMVLRCVVFVDKIQRIEIMTTTRELLLGESPEVFHVKAFDDEGKTTPPPSQERRQDNNNLYWGYQLHQEWFTEGSSTRLQHNKL